MDIKKVHKFLQDNLTRERFLHSLNAATYAVVLAKTNKADIAKAEIAGLLHDAGKNKDFAKMISIFKTAKKPKNYEMLVKYAPHLLHSFASEIIAKHLFLIKDKEILEAIRDHTIGDKNMSPLSKIIFVADSACADRRGKETRLIRKLAKTNLNEAFIVALQSKMIYTFQTKKWIYPKTIDIWNYYVSKNFYD